MPNMFSKAAGEAAKRWTASGMGFGSTSPPRSHTSLQVVLAKKAEKLAKKAASETPAGKYSFTLPR
jgi:hypothetical protein